MPISVTDYLKIDKKKFDKSGALDTLLDMDSRFFIEPKLLYNLKLKEFKTASDKIDNTFKTAIKLLSKSQREGDIQWDNAKKLFSFHEPDGIGIGYSKHSIRGRGLAGKNTDKILIAAKNIIDQGVTDSEIFQLITIFAGRGIGVDFISDMIASIIYEFLLLYSHNVFKNFRIKKEIIEYEHKIYELPINPYTKKQIVLIPKLILKDIPLSADLLRNNQNIRKQIYKIIREAKSKKKVNLKRIEIKKSQKLEIQNVLIKNPSLLKELIQTYKSIKVEAYDFESDPSGEYIWYKTSKEFSEKYPLVLKKLKKENDYKGLYKIVIDICKHYKFLIENKGSSRLLYDKSGKPMPEKYAQCLFHTSSSAILKSNNIDISSETDTGRGIVDFKITRGNKFKVLVELKLSHNQKLINGLAKQLIEYGIAEQTNKLIYIVIDFGTKKSKLEKLKESLDDIKNQVEVMPEVIIIDAKKKLSASRL